MNDVESRVIKCVMDELDEQKAEVNAGSNLVNDLGMDSLDRIELAMKIEAEFDLEINDESFDSFQTVGDIITFIDSAAPK